MFARYMARSATRPLLGRSAFQSSANVRLERPYVRAAAAMSMTFGAVMFSGVAVEAASADAKAKKPQIVFVLGGPGAGKGTQCQNIVDTFKFKHLSAGDLLRAERLTGSKDAELINNYIKEGKIVPVEVTIALLKKAIDESFARGVPNFLIDGFPRNEDNDDGWRRIMGDKADVRFVLFLDCPEAVMERRLLRRGETSGRSDDNADSIRLRFRTYVNETRPIIERYSKQGLVHKISSDQTVEQVFSQVSAIFNKEFGGKK